MNSQLKAGVVLSYVSMVIGYLISIAYTPIMLRLMGQSEYGLYNLVASVIAYLGVLNFGFGSSYIRHYTILKNKSDNYSIEKLNGTFLLLYSFIALVTIICGFVLSKYTSIIFGDNLTTEEMTRASILLVILSINLAISFIGIVFTSYIRANEKFVFQNIVLLAKKITSPFIILPILFLGYGSLGMAFAITIINIAVELAYIIFSKKRLKIKFRFRNASVGEFKEIIIFSSFIFINIIVDQINWQVDKYLLGIFFGTVSVAIYSLASQINSYYITLSTTISSVFAPRVHKLVDMEKKIEIDELFIKVGRIQYILLMLFLLGFIVFGRPFINWWAGNQYSESYYIILILISSATIPIIQNIGIEIQRAKYQHRFRSYMYFFIALINLGISIPLTKTYGGVGAAFGTAFALLIGNGLIMNIYYSKKTNIDIISFWRNILSISKGMILPILVGVYFMLFLDLNKILNFILAGFVFVCVYLLSMYFIGANNYEKKLVKSIFTRLSQVIRRK